jgi:hypothetical protein
MAKEMKYKPFQENDKVWLEGTHLKLPYETMKLAPRRVRTIQNNCQSIRCRILTQTVEDF